MKKFKKIICFDLDGVICDTNHNYYNESKPKKDVIKFINKLYLKKYYIKIFTSRHMSRFKGDIKKVYANEYQNTFKQLKTWKLKFHELVLGKTSYDFFIDDKCPYHTNSWIKILEKKLKNDQ